MAIEIIPTIDSNMIWINTLIFNKLSDICPTLKLRVEDRRVLDTCCRDFRNYLNYINTNHLKIDNSSIQEVPQEDASLAPFFAIIMNELHQTLQDIAEVSEFLNVWVSWWWRKWIQRTKIILNVTDVPKNSISVGGGSLTNSLSSEERGELTKIVIDKLIQYGEISCTEIISDSLIKKAVEDMKNVTIENKIQLISKLQRQVKMISYTHGVLVFIRPDNYFKVAEWRNDGTTPSSPSNKIV